MSLFSIIISIGSFLVNHWEGIVSILTGLCSLLGISILQVKNRENKIEQEKIESQLIAESTPEKAQYLKEIKIKRKQKGKFEFTVNNILLVFGLVGLNWLVFEIFKMPVFSKDIDFIKSILGWLLFLDCFILIMIAGRIVSSINTFDSFIQNLPLIKSFFKK